MDEYRSRSFGNGKEMELYGKRIPPVPPPPGMSGLRSHSTSSYTNSNHPTVTNKDLKRTKTTCGSSSSRSGRGCWNLSDPEMQRKRRIASYKLYSVEGKMKGSFRKSFRWIRDKCSYVVHGWW